MHRESFLHPFLQTARGAGIEMHQLAMQTFQRPLGVAVIRHAVSISQFSSHVSLEVLGKVIDHVTFPVYLAALNEGRFPAMMLDRRAQGFAAVENIEPWRSEIQTAL